MTTMASPKRTNYWNERTQSFGQDTPKIIYAPTEWGVGIECEVSDPPSMKGKRIVVRFEPDICDEMLRLFKEYAIRRRNQPMENNR